MKGFSSVVVIVIVAALLVLGGWYWSQQGGSVATSESTSTPATGGAAQPVPAPTTGQTSVTTETQTASTGNADIDGAMGSITAGADAYSSQAASEDGTEGATSVTTSLNNQPDYVQ